jgi:hypothetical protein
MDITENLKNDHNVYILGAGFSYEAGLPLISDFLLRMRDSHEWLIEQNRVTEAKAVAAVLDFRLKAASAAYWVKLDLENIEELFSLASASAGDIGEQIRLAIAATLDYAQKTKGALNGQLSVSHSKSLFKSTRMPDWLKFKSSDDVNNHRYYSIRNYTLIAAYLLGMFKNFTPKGENTFITFNYDTLLEDALIELGIDVNYGSKISAHPSCKDPKRKDQIPVFKLHGSMNWARANLPNSQGSQSITVFNNYNEVREKNLVPELIPPTWKKIFENQLESVWDEAIQKLKTATRIIVIGFSMPPTDLHFKYLLAAGLKDNISLRKVVFVNPDEKDELKPRVKELLREAYIESNQITFVKSGLLQFTIQRNMFGGDAGLHNLGRPTEYSASMNFQSDQIFD